jgi:hypothetical protein
MVGQNRAMVQINNRRSVRQLQEEQRSALREFATLGISVADFLSRMHEFIEVGEFVPGHREINAAPMPGETISISRDDVRWVLRRYLHGKLSGEELSNRAGVFLAISAYTLPSGDGDDVVLEVLTDVALPVKERYLDRDALKARVAKL